MARLKKLNKIIKNCNRRIDTLENEVQKEYNTMFKDNVYIKDTIIKLESSKEYGQDDTGIYQWIRFDVSKFKDCVKYLSTFLSEEYYVTLDFKNDALQLYIGPCLVLNSDGEVFCEDSRDFILSKDAYISESELFALVEKYREKSGIYSGLFKVDNYGNVKLINC